MPFSYTDAKIILSNKLASLIDYQSINQLDL